MLQSHLPSQGLVDSWPEFTRTRRLNCLVSACITGLGCGVDGGSYGAPYLATERLLRLPNVRTVPFCPEDHMFGTPRETPDIHGGNGFDVLDGNARVFSSTGTDWTDQMIEAAETMLALALRERVHVALLLDISAACGTQVIYLGDRREGRYQPGPGVAAALLIRNGIPVLSHRDFRTLGRVISHLDASFLPDEATHDHHESDWYVSTFAP